MQPNKSTRRLLAASSALVAAAVGLAQAEAFIFNEQECAPITRHVPYAPNLMIFADRSNSMAVPIEQTDPVSRSANPTTQGTFEPSLMIEPANAADNPRSTPGITLSTAVFIPPFAWVANHDYGTASRFNVDTMQEEGRYAVGGSPSRTTVDLDGNAWVGARSDGMLTKILWNKTACPDKSGNGRVDTSNGSNVRNDDECVVYNQKPYPGLTIRGLAAGPDGRVWIGYSEGYIQSIDSATFQLGPLISTGSIPLYQRDGSGVFQSSGSNASGCGVYGMVIDREGMLYLSNFCRDRLPVYDTKKERWHALYYTPGESGLYGITIDAERRVWMGGWPSMSGVRMFNPVTRRIHNFPTPGGGERVTGLAVEAATGDVWASFYNTSQTGRLRFNPTNFASYNWTIINSLPTPFGIGFDAKGTVWTVGVGSNNIFAINPATNQRDARLPNGVPVGQGTHYTYSDFTGSTALSFTAPSGRWNNIFDLGGAQVLSLTLDAHVPVGTSLGIRYRSLNTDGSADSDWYPASIGGSPQYYPYNPGQPSQIFLPPQLNDQPFTAPKLELEVRLSTSDKGVRPYLYGVSFTFNSTTTLWSAAKNLANDLSNSFNAAGACTGGTNADGTGCDFVRIGMAYFNENLTYVTDVNEDTTGTINNSLPSTTTDGLTKFLPVAQAINQSPSLKDPNRKHFAMIITDGKINTIANAISSVRELCQANRRAIAPVTTYLLSPGLTADPHMMSFFGAAGGTATCRQTANQAPLDLCTQTDAQLASYLLQSGTSPFTETTLNTQVLACEKPLYQADLTRIKNELRLISRDSSCVLPLEIPRDPAMYNRPSFPQLGALETPRSLMVRMDHRYWSILDLPYCPPGEQNCGMEQNLKANGIDATTAAGYKHEGWYFDNAIRSHLRLTPTLCDQIAQRRVRHVQTQLACQCRYEGQPCTTGAVGRCAEGTYACIDGEDVCLSNRRPMPEICNGLDDNCDGQTDNISDTKAMWSALGGEPSNTNGQHCNMQNACVCEPNHGNTYIGAGTSPREELMSYITGSGASAETDKCYCSSGLMGEEEASFSDDGASASPDAPSAPSAQGQAACATTSQGPNAPGALMTLAGLALLAVARRRRAA